MGRQNGYILIKDDNLLNKYNTVWDKNSADVKIELYSEPVYNKKTLKTKKMLGWWFSRWRST